MSRLLTLTIRLVTLSSFLSNLETSLLSLTSCLSRLASFADNEGWKRVVVFFVIY